MKRFILILVVSLFLTLQGYVNAYAYDASFFRTFLNKEVHVTVQLNDYKTKTYTIYLQKIDYNKDMLIGYENLGHRYIEISKVVGVKAGQRNTQKVFNHHIEP